MGFEGFVGCDTEEFDFKKITKTSIISAGDHERNYRTEFGLLIFPDVKNGDDKMENTFMVDYYTKSSIT